jgi:NifU-like protein involved in Fe-S cluster formation|tara:strand:+ start:2651 stop:3061 length:411 start_codon:yes stop_codon:yes gene_type:complete
VTKDAYREILEFHAEHPQGSEPLEDHDCEGTYRSQKTGNHCSVRIKLADGAIERLSAEVKGSALARACASLMVSALVGVRMSEARKTALGVKSFLEAKDASDLPGELIVYRSILSFPERFDCALLAWRAFLESEGS